MEARDIGLIDAGKRRARADREVAVRVAAIDLAGEHGLRVHAGHVAELPDAIQPECAHTVEVGRIEARPHDDVGEQGEGLGHEAVE